MGNAIESFASGFGKAISNLLQAPVDFLSGKSCSSVCGPTWDLSCYVENFCVANLLKLGLIITVGYIVLLIIYLTYKLRIFQCIGCCIFKLARTCSAACFYTCKNICHCCFRKLRNTKRRRREFHVVSMGSFVDPNERSLNSFVDDKPRVLSYKPTSREQRKGHFVRRSLRPRNHRVRVGVFFRKDYRTSDRRYSMKKRRGHGSTENNVHGISVTKTSRFAHKGKMGLKTRR